jgi:transcriptional regulator GlxA family with amidase domain
MLIYPGVTPMDVAGPVTTKAGVGFMPTCAMGDLALPVDTLMVSGGGRPRSWITREITDWLRVAASQTRRFGSICTGAFLLGGRRVTTHWASCEDLAQRHPAARVEVDPIFIRESGFFSTAGISAGIDLALALVVEDHEREFALHIARYLVLYLKRSGGQAQYSTRLRMQVAEVRRSSGCRPGVWTIPPATCGCPRCARSRA